MKFCSVFLICLLGSVNSQNCIYSNHCAADVCPAGSDVHCLDARCKCLTLSGPVQSSTCAQRSDCPVGACPTGNVMHCLDGHCKCIVDSVNMCDEDEDCVVSHNYIKECGPPGGDGQWECHHKLCRCAHEKLDKCSLPLYMQNSAIGKNLIFFAVPVAAY